MKWTAPGGLIILRIPDQNSADGAVARMSPFWFHVMYWRLVHGIKEAGTPGFGPHPTYHEPLVSRQGVEEFCAAHNCRILDFFGHGYYLTYDSGRTAGLLAKGGVAAVAGPLFLAAQRLHVHHPAGLTRMPAAVGGKIILWSVRASLGPADRSLDMFS